MFNLPEILYGKAGEYMSFFETINDKFFNPFCCKNREIYFECISQLIERSKEIPILYETEARNCLILYLRNCIYSIETENIGEEVSGRRTPQENASSILRYFRSCGWITPREIGRNGDNIASISTYCRRLMDAIHKIFDRNASSAITNHIFSIYEILKSSLEKNSIRALRPYSTILEPLIDRECDLKNELWILQDSIREIMHAVMKMADVNSFGQFLMKDELLNRFFSDYFFIKKSGLIPSYLSEINQMLNCLKNSALYEQMAKEYQELKNVDSIYAMEKIDRQFGELDNFINLEYEQEMSLIDKKINTYYYLYSTRVTMVLSNHMNLENSLNQLLLQLKDMEEEERAFLLQEIAYTHRLQSIGFIGRKSFERRRRVRPDMKNAGILEETLSQEEKLRLTAELLTEIPDRYGMDHVKDYFDQKTFLDGELSTEECEIHTREDAMMIAAGVIYSGTDGFPYEVEFEEGMIETEIAAISKIKMKRKRNG